MKSERYECTCGNTLFLSYVSLVVDDEVVVEEAPVYRCDECSETLVLKNDHLKSWIIANASLELTNQAVSLFELLMENTNPRTYFLHESSQKEYDENNKLLRVSDIHKLTKIKKDQVDSVINELESKNIINKITVNGVPLLLVNPKKVGLPNDDKTLKNNYFMRWVYEDGKRRKKSNKRDKILKNMVNDFTDSEKDEVLRYFDGRCALTGKDVPLQWDHVIPVSTGHAGTTKANMLPIWQRINSSKGARNIFEWYEENGDRFGVCPERFKEAIRYMADLNEMTPDEYRRYVYDCHENKNENLTEVC